MGLTYEHLCLAGFSAVIHSLKPAGCPRNEGRRGTEASALELAKSKLHKDEDAPAAAAAAAKLAESVEQLEPLLAVQTTRSTSAEAGLKPSVAHQVCKLDDHA